MTFLAKLSPTLALRIGFGLMYLYSGYDLMTNPRAWTWALPYWLRNIIGAVIPVETYLRIQGGAEIVMALLLLSWFLKPSIVKIVAVLSALEMGGILLLAFFPWNANNFLITFRDIGLLGGTVALVALLFRERAPDAS